MSRIILYDHIHHCFKFIHPGKYLVQNITEDDRFTVSPRVLPSLLDAEFLLLLSGHSDIAKELKLVGAWQFDECSVIWRYFRDS